MGFGYGMPVSGDFHESREEFPYESEEQVEPQVVRPMRDRSLTTEGNQIERSGSARSILIRPFLNRISPEALKPVVVNEEIV